MQRDELDVLPGLVLQRGVGPCMLGQGRLVAHLLAGPAVAVVRAACEGFELVARLGLSRHEVVLEDGWPLCVQLVGIDAWLLIGHARFYRRVQVQGTLRHQLLDSERRGALVGC